MAEVNVRIWDITASRSTDLATPDHVEVERLIAVLIDRMGLPINSPDGQVMVYKLHHRRSGRQLFDDQTLADAGVRDGDELRLQPEITAGAAAR